MKVLIEVRGGMVDRLTATEECDIYIVDHDNLKERGDDGSSMREPYHPNFVSYETSMMIGDENIHTPIFDSILEDTIINSD